MPIATTRRARALATALRELRERSGITSRDLSAQLGLSHSTVSHWETGKRIPTTEDVASVLGAVGVNGDDRGRILNLARHAMDENWLTHGIPGLPEQLAGAVECERDATAITDWSPSIVPGLLQTRAYAQMTISASGRLDAGDVESRVFVKMGRRGVLESSSVQYYPLIGEAVLYEPVAATDVMLEQLRYIQQMAQRRNVHLQIVESGIGWHPGLHGPFIYYEFEDTPESVVYFEHYSSGAFVQEPKDVLAYGYVIEDIKAKAADESKSAELLVKRIRELEKVV